MDSKTAIDILKEAILLERRGKVFYSNIAEKTDSPAVKKVFSMMAEEEEEHIKFLSKQFAHYAQNSSFAQNKLPETDVNEEIALAVFTKEIKKQISAASFEAAAISAAIDFETRAVKVYSDRAEAAKDPNEKEMYKMLADWEKGHHHFLNKLNEELKESIWFDNQFWPF